MLRKKVARGKVIEFFVKLPACLIGMEACPEAHHWGREVMKLGHSVKLMPAQYVKAYLKGNKNDGNDAEAICEAFSRPGMRFVAMNTEAQQDTQMLHRIRHRLVGERTALITKIRGLLGEYGIVFAQGPGQVRRGLVRLLGDNELSGFALELLSDLHQQLTEIDERIAGYDARVQRACAADDQSRKLDALPGFGALTATAMVAASPVSRKAKE